MKFTEHPNCTSRFNCGDRCLTDAKWRKEFGAPEPNIVGGKPVCSIYPEVTLETAPALREKAIAEHDKPRSPCQYLGKENGQFVECPDCSGKIRLKKFACSVFGECTPTKKADGVACCTGCPRYEPIAAASIP